MQNKTRIHTLLASSAATAALISGPCYAEDMAPEAASAEIVVSAAPLRESMAASIEIKREATNIVDAITADTAGRFPDQTVAGALARLPGIGVQRDQGQERYVQVRGAPTRWTVVSFDGINVLGAEERIFRFDSVPAALISTVQLNKTLLPEMPAEALAGRVNIKTYSAMRNKGFHMLVDGGYGFNDLGDGPQEQIAGRVSWANDTVGITIAGSHNQFEQQTDNAEPRYDAVGLNNLRNAKYIIVRENNSLSGKLEFAPADGQKITATSLFTEFLDHEERNQYTFSFSGLTGTRSYQQGSLNAVPVVGAFEKGEYKNSTWINILHGDHEFGAIRLGWDAAYVETESKTVLPIINQSSTTAALRPNVSYTTGEYGLPVLTISDAGGIRSSLNQQAFNRETLTQFESGSKTKSYTGKLDLAYDWNLFGADSTLRFGGQWDQRKSDDPGATALIRPNGTVGTLALRDVAAQLGVAWTPGNLVTATPVDENLNRGYTFNYIDNRTMREQLDTLIAAARTANGTGASIPVPATNPALANTVKERIIAGYVSNSWKWDQLTVVAGLRIENTKVTAEGVANLGGTLTPVSFMSDNTLFFPSLHFAYDLTDALKLRAAFITGAARPTFPDQRATVTIIDAGTIETVTGGNPSLKPERAIGADASAEWYFGESSLLSVSGFYRRVKDTMFDSTSIVGDDRFNFNGVDRSGYTYTTTLNGGSGKLYGVEFSYNQPFTFLPAPFDGFGAQASLALVDGTFETPTGRKVAFPGTSKRIANLSVFYEKSGFSARVGYQHRTDWLDDISVDTNSDLYWDAQQRVDLSVRYEIVKNFTFYADVINLTDEAGIRYQGDETRPYEVELFGRRYLFGVRASF